MGWRVRKPKQRMGVRLLEAFLIANDIPLRAASRLLRVKHPAVWTWIHRRAVPRPPMRRRIAAWTKGAVPESSWETPEEAAEDALEIEPYEPEPKVANGSE